MKLKAADFLALTLLHLKNVYFGVFLRSFSKNIWSKASELGTMNLQPFLKLIVQS